MATDYDPDEDDGPEARLLRQQVSDEERARQRTDALLRAIERDGDPIAQGRAAAERLWRQVCDSLRGSR